MKRVLKYNYSDDSENTVLRSIPNDDEAQETMVLPPPDETLILEQKSPLLKDISASNPFCNQASSLLSLVPKIRVQSTHDNISDLHQQLVTAMIKFGTIDSTTDISEKQKKIASYFLCALLDETILNTPWGRQGNWEEYSLLRKFHGDGQEGKKFFIILKQLLQNPRQYLHLIELAYICLSLGYEGVFGLKENSPRTISEYQKKLFNFIQRVKGPEDDNLSANWRGVKETRKSMLPEIPLWVTLVISGLLLMLIYFGMIYLINRNSDDVSQRLDRIAQKEPTLPSSQPLTQIPKENSLLEVSNLSPRPEGNSKEAVKDVLDAEKLKEALSYELERKMVQILAGPTIRVVNIFRSGSDQVKEEFMPMLAKIAKILKRYDVRILIIGHTDNQPIFTGRFPSNWHLSEARAKSVATHLAVTAELSNRIRYEGHGADDPVASNDTEENRTLNRRIDIHIR